MDKETFAQAAAGGSPEESPIEFDLDSKLRELKVSGDQAYLWIETTLGDVSEKWGSVHENGRAFPFDFRKA